MRWKLTAVLFILLSFFAILHAGPGAAVYLDQGWSGTDREWFYSVDQGSEFMPWDFFSSIEKKDSPDLFSSVENLKSYGFIYDSSRTNLPIGFVRHENNIGFTCAACHTNEIEYRGKTIRIDGGASLADVARFIDDLTEALQANLENQEKFGRLATRLLGQRASSAESREILRRRLETVKNERQRYSQDNRPDAPYGPGRLDAFGRIYNRVLTLTGSKERVRANAPVSYPYLWDAPRHDFVQWVGGVSNAGAGALARNVGQVVGVFGTIDLTALRPGYVSSIHVRNLAAIESKLMQLKSPPWPQNILPGPDARKVAEGRKLYERECLSCHQDIDRAGALRTVTAQMYGLEIIGTDPATARNVVNAEADTGNLKGRFIHVVGTIQKFGPRSPVNYMLRHIVEGVMLQFPGRTAGSTLINAGWIGTSRHGNFPVDPANPLSSLLTYKARPLNGIWATAPFLHNGSVPTLYDLLLRASDRPQKFFTGLREFDPSKVGFVSDRGPFEFDTSLPGNRNTGHEYGASLSDSERAALLDYLKTL